LYGNWMLWALVGGEPSIFIKNLKALINLGPPFYALPEGLCALRKIYARSRSFMRVHGDLCAFIEFYARSGSFMRVQGALCAFKELYARSGNFMRAHLLRQGR
jgi:hypothetical protein